MRNRPVILLILFTSCALGNNKYMIADRKFGDSEIFNYEYMNRYIAKEIRREHFLLNIVIDSPMVIDLPDEKFENIYPLAGITGDAVVFIKLNDKGKVTDYSFIKRAGLGLDDYVDFIIKNINFRPVSHKGTYGTSSICARFIFQPNEEL